MHILAWIVVLLALMVLGLFGLAVLVRMETHGMWVRRRSGGMRR